MVIDLVLLIQHSFVGAGGQAPADEMIKVLQLIVAVHLALDGYLGVVDQRRTVTGR